jgi:hypothetical protein
MKVRPVSYFPNKKIELQQLNVDGTHKISKWNESYEVTHECRNLKFIHVGKCGGTSIVHEFLNSGVNMHEFHLQRPNWNANDWYLLWLRNPIKRFVSAFNHSKDIINYDTSDLDLESISLENTPAPMKIISKIKNGYAFNPRYDSWIGKFPSANALAESLSSSNPVLKRDAHMLMNSRTEHLYKGIGWYLDNGVFVEKFSRQVFFVGRLEQFDTDFKKFSTKLELPIIGSNGIQHKRLNTTKLSKDLSQKAIDNILRFYAATDYAALKELKRKNLIDVETLESYYEY